MFKDFPTKKIVSLWNLVEILLLLLLSFIDLHSKSTRMFYIFIVNFTPLIECAIMCHSQVDKSRTPLRSLSIRTYLPTLYIYIVTNEENTMYLSTMREIKLWFRFDYRIGRQRCMDRIGFCESFWSILEIWWQCRTNQCKRCQLWRVYWTFWKIE